ncbi:MAG: NlpC/P60 family protein [Alphaproteobacteria bacterium]|nr:NlpC/P60 family protein [Alphaproteobacteria bacterium]
MGSKNNFTENNANSIEKKEAVQSVKFATKDTLKSSFYFKNNASDSIKSNEHSAQTQSKDSQNISEKNQESHLFFQGNPFLQTKLTNKYLNIIGDPYIFEINSNLLGFVDEWMGIDHKYGGKDKNGIDCSGLVHAMFKTLYHINTSGSSLHVFQECVKLKSSELKEGDLVFFKTTSKSISHVGIYLTNNKFVHCSSSYGVTISDLRDGYYAARFVGAGRFPIPQSNSESFLSTSEVTPHFSK